MAPSNHHHVADDATRSSSSDSSSSSASTATWGHEQGEEQSWQPPDPTTDTTEDSPEKERQLLLLMLLAQVCALHDPSPKTFTVHVLEFFERGILDRESIRFLFELGLVPTHHAPSTTSPLLMSNEQVMAALTANDETNALQVVKTTTPMTMEQARAQEASAIRLHLEQSHHGVGSEKQHANAERHSSWAVEHHPLSLSRYQREFRQIRLLNAGAFGQVFHVVSKLDGTEYAIKRVAFGVSGYQSEKITQAVREVQCLAQCHHPHCVRYYTSWLEPSWMTGSSSGIAEEQPLLLTNGSQQEQRSVSSSSSFGGLLRRRRASFSFGAYDNENDDAHHFHEWTQSKDDSFVTSPAHAQTTSPTSQYRYEICLFIQMQLCNPMTLADWIRQRNASSLPRKARAGPAIQIFTQLIHGMAHVHEKHIVHRDVKPANIFMGQDGHFLIGDFGLSRLLQKAGREFGPSSNSTADSLTVGIGTASYAAPEQLACCDYGTAADIFGLGLILLELFCLFETEHERIDTFRQCRSRSLPSWLSDDYPHVAEIIFKCTHVDPAKRPTAADLCANVLTEQDVLRLQLREKDQELKKQRSEIDEKDRIIEELKSQVKRMSMEQSEGGMDQKLAADTNVSTVESPQLSDEGEDNY